MKAKFLSILRIINPFITKNIWHSNTILTKLFFWKLFNILLCILLIIISYKFNHAFCEPKYNTYYINLTGIGKIADDDFYNFYQAYYDFEYNKFPVATVKEKAMLIACIIFIAGIACIIC